MSKLRDCHTVAKRWKLMLKLSKRFFLWLTRHERERTIIWSMSLRILDTFISYVLVRNQITSSSEITSTTWRYPLSWSCHWYCSLSVIFLRTRISDYFKYSIRTYFLSIWLQVRRSDGLEISIGIIVTTSSLADCIIDFSHHPIRVHRFDTSSNWHTWKISLKIRDVPSLVSSVYYKDTNYISDIH